VNVLLGTGSPGVSWIKGC